MELKQFFMKRRIKYFVFLGYSYMIRVILIAVLPNAVYKERSGKIKYTNFSLRRLDKERYYLIIKIFGGEIYIQRNIGSMNDIIVTINIYRSI